MQPLNLMGRKTRYRGVFETSLSEGSRTPDYNYVETVFTYRERSGKPQRNGDSSVKMKKLKVSNAEKNLEK